MAKSCTGAVLVGVRTLFGSGALGGLSDGQLLERFVTLGGEDAELAFETLVHRHGPMVLRVSRETLNDPADADDAFQATFLVLARKAGSLWVRDSIGPWLHQVAYRVASHARSDSSRRKRLERRAAELTVSSGFDPGEHRDDLGPVLHEEINRLPDRCRAPVVLCYLEGLTHEQAAHRLGWPVGTVRSRLSRGRHQLRHRLERRGVAPSAVALVLRSARTCPTVPFAMTETTLHAATRFAAGGATMAGVGPVVAALTANALRTLTMNTLCKLSASVLLVGLVASVAGGLMLRESVAEASATKTVPTASASASAPDPAPSPAPTTPKPAAPQSEAEQIAERILQHGSELFDNKQAEALANTYTEDGEIHLISEKDGAYQDDVTQGRSGIETFYGNLFKNAGTIDSKNTVEFARLVRPNVLVIHGRFQPNTGENELPFVQMRTKHGEDWLMSKLWLFLGSGQ